MLKNGSSLIIQITKFSDLGAIMISIPKGELKIKFGKKGDMIHFLELRGAFFGQESNFPAEFLRECIIHSAMEVDPDNPGSAKHTARVMKNEWAMQVKRSVGQLPTLRAKDVVEQCLRPEHRKMFFWDRAGVGLSMAYPRAYTIVVAACINSKFRNWLVSLNAMVTPAEEKVVIPKILMDVFLPRHVTTYKKTSYSLGGGRNQLLGFPSDIKDYIFDWNCVFTLDALNESGAPEVYPGEATDAMAARARTAAELEMRNAAMEQQVAFLTARLAQLQVVVPGPGAVDPGAVLAGARRVLIPREESKMEDEAHDSPDSEGQLDLQVEKKRKKKERDSSPVRRSPRKK